MREVHTMSPPKGFHHPYTPYSIQTDLMNSIYDNTLDRNKKIAIVESPTGTGKTLSLICATVTWLRDNKSDLLTRSLLHKENNTTAEEQQEEISEEENEPEWVVEGYKDATTRETLQLLNDYESFLDKLDPLEVSPSVKYISQKGKKTHSDSKRKKLVDLDFLPDEYNSDDEKEGGGIVSNAALGNEIKDLLNKINKKTNNKTTTNNNVNASPNPVKIFFASRTHSQLNQFANQLKLPKFDSSFESVPIERIKYLPLGSKKQLCIEPSVKRWGTLEAINDACYDLRHSKNGCPFYQNTPQWRESRDTINFRDNIFKEIHDIEELVPLGESLNVCPYYASRDALIGAEIISLPYQYLLSESTRNNLNIDIKDSIIIIDEAHNLIDTINNIYSATLTLSDLDNVLIGLQNYLNKFQKRLSPNNRVNLLKLLKLLETIKFFINKNFIKPGQKINNYDILNDTNSDLLNIHKLIKYINKSKVAYKIDTYMAKLHENDSSNKNKQPLLFRIVSFLNTLTHPSKEGQYFFEKDKSIKYLLLEPSKMIDPLVKESRCLILAGGTMEPVADFYNNLFPNVSKDDITTFSCNHVIPTKNLETFIINEPQFEFTFAKRNDKQLINNNLFNFYLNLSNTVPITGGIVGFFPSYQYLQMIIDQWKSNGNFQKLANTREIYYETKDGDDILSDYINKVSKGEGAILFAIVGGKLSEGINFQDNLCRAVVMTGLPFPNVFSGELQIKKTHLENKILSNGGAKQDAMNATKEFFENICMKAVNQSVGRAIRHANDYAAIYLLDKRYATDNIRQKLSLWVRERIQQQQSLPDILKQTDSFFKNWN